MKIANLIAAAAVAAALSGPALAQAAAGPPPEWQGEGSVGAGVTTGNTSTTDANAGVKLKHNGETWSESGEFQADYAKTNGVETKNRLAAAGQVDRNFTDRLSGFVRGAWEEDRFSGFANRYFAGVGAAYKVINTDPTKWAVQLGVGYKVDEIRTLPATLTTPLIPSTTKEGFGAIAGSRFKQQINDKVALTNDTDVTYASTSTQIADTLALTFQLMGNFSGRISYDVRYDTNPPGKFKNTDTATRLSVVYKLS